jgi:hypothetical protein
MSSLNGLGKSEKSIIFGSVVGLLICLFFLFDGGRRFHVTRSSSGERIGTLTVLKNDTRYKSKDDLVFVTAAEQDGVEIGDSVFSGDKSYAVVEMRKGEQITVGENSLVTFREMNSEKLADLQTGNFRIKVDGTVKVAIQGEVTTLEGKNSEVQLVTDGKTKPRIRVLKGKTTVKRSHAKAIVIENTREIASLDIPTPVTLPVQLPPPPETPKDLSQIGKVSYIWRLYDLYEQKNFQLFSRDQIPDFAPVQIKLSWTQSKANKIAKLELAKLNDFREATKLDGGDGFVNLPKAYLGANFWRVSFDGIHWSSTEQFDVEGEFLKDGRPTAVASVHDIPLLASTAVARVVLSSSLAHIGFVVEAATDENFAKEQTRTFWSEKSTVNLSFFKPGKYFYRFRTVNNAQELTDWSQTEVFSVFVPVRPHTPTLLSQTPKKGFVVREKPKLIIAQKPPPKAEQKRKPASVESTSVAKFETPASHLNDTYKDSEVAVQGFLWTMYSGEQTLQ